MPAPVGTMRSSSSMPYVMFVVDDISGVVEAAFPIRSSVRNAYLFGVEVPRLVRPFEPILKNGVDVPLSPAAKSGVVPFCSTESVAHDVEVPIPRFPAMDEDAEDTNPSWKYHSFVSDVDDAV